MAKKTRTQLKNQSASTFPTNGQGQITAAATRDFLADLLDSVLVENPNWEQNNDTALDFIKNRTHHKEVAEPVTIFEGDTEAGNYYYSAQKAMQTGREYGITFNASSNVSSAQVAEADENGDILVTYGTVTLNINIYGDGSGDNIYINLYNTDTGEERDSTVLIEEYDGDVEYFPLDINYMPREVVAPLSRIPQFSELIIDCNQNFGISTGLVGEVKSGLTTIYGICNASTLNRPDASLLPVAGYLGVLKTIIISTGTEGAVMQYYHCVSANTAYVRSRSGRNSTAWKQIF
jgi:hypothetical protein